MTTQPGSRRSADVTGTPLAALITRADDAYAMADVSTLDRAYRDAAGTADTAELRCALADDHAGRLLALGRPAMAVARCDEYLADAVDPGRLPVRLRRAEAYCAISAYAAAAQDAAGVRAALVAPLTDRDEARLCRVEALAAAGHGDTDRAVRELERAGRLFAGAGATGWADLVAGDRRLLAARAGDEPTVSAVLAADPPVTTAGRVLLAAALRARQRYEDSVDALAPLDTPQADPAVRLAVRAEIATLLRLLRRDDEATEFAGATAGLAGVLPAHVTAEQLARLSMDAGPDVPAGVGPAVAHARRLIVQGRLVDAERALVDIRPRLASAADIAAWWLGAGELNLTYHRWLGEESRLRTAIGQLRRSVAAAGSPALVEGRIVALRTLGRACFRLAEDTRAAECWSEAHRLEERVAACQRSDDGRLRMLSAASDEHDERVRAAAELAERLAATGDDGVASIVLAIEAARGSTILAAVTGDSTAVARDLPRLSDMDGARTWLAALAGTLPRSQIVWLVYATPLAVHHALVGPDVLRHVAVPCRRGELVDAIEDHLATVDPAALAAAVRGGDFDASLATIAALLDLPAVVSRVPEAVTRIAVVAAGELACVPFAALPLASGPLGRRYALSDLPCLTALGPLRERSARQRGDSRLYVSPRDGLTRARHRGPRRRRLLDAGATPAALRERVTALRPHRIRIDAHGGYRTGQPWIRLAPPDRLTPDQVGGLALDRCGTLILGACESGMARLRGRAEQDGFVRAAMHAGTSAVIAARWAADDPAAAVVLDRFERYLRYLPRDVALHRALLDLPAGMHPARWACWTVYGDTGRQTAAGRVRRGLRAGRDRCADATHSCWRTVVTRTSHP